VRECPPARSASDPESAFSIQDGWLRPIGAYVGEMSLLNALKSPFGMRPDHRRLTREAFIPALTRSQVQSYPLQVNPN
jgi:hypothetical protein